MDKSKVILFGSIPTAAKCLKLLIEKGCFDIRGVVTETGYRCSWSPGKPHVEDIAAQHKIPLIDLNEILEMQCDWGFSIRFNQILKPKIIESFSKKIINIHGGPLPYYRGPNCSNWAIIDGREEFGISAHFIDSGIDTGDLVKTVWWKINDTDTAGDLFFRALDEITILFSKIIDKIAIQGDILHIRQDEIKDKPWPIRTTKLKDLDIQRKINIESFLENPQRTLRLIRAFDFPDRNPLTIKIDNCDVALRLYKDEIA